MLADLVGSSNVKRQGEGFTEYVSDIFKSRTRILIGIEKHSAMQQSAPIKQRGKAALIVIRTGSKAYFELPTAFLSLLFFSESIVFTSGLLLPLFEWFEPDWASLSPRAPTLRPMS